MFYVFSLTDEQENIIKAAEEGHNLFISGKAGTGKSFVVSHILKSLRRLGREVVVVCASGISCSVFDDAAKTVHSHYALQTADMPADMVISRAASLPHCVHRICAADTIVWDEVGMSSQRVFEIVNAIHHEVSKGDDQWKPFGGKQVILVGEFLQLKPVPNTFDNGEFIFRSVLFRIAFGHRFELTRLMRQDTASAEFTKALRELRLGVCSDDSTHVLRSLSRPISHESPVHIYFKKLSVQMHNSEVLFRMPGQLFSYECIDEGNVQGINCPADSKVLMKPNAKVMIVWNLSDNIKNGTAGIFLGVRDDLLEVQVASEQKTVYLKRQTWSKRNRTGQIVGSRTQYPVTLFYASTCHKTQGLTLPSAIVHCSREFVSGLTYVATSRVKNEKDLQILNFSPEHLLQPLQEALTVCHNTIPELPDLSCCSDQQLREEHFIVSDRNGEELADNDDVYLHGYETLAMERYADGNICSFFEREDDNVVIDLETVLVMLDVGEAQFSSPAEYVDLRQLASGMEMPNPRSEFALENNKNIAIVLERMELFDCFVKIQWLRIYDLFIDHLKENINELYMSRKDLTDATHYLYTKIIGSANLRQESQLLFDVQEVTESHHSMVSTICMELFEKFIHAVADAIDREHNTADIIFNVSEMHAEGLAKLRHVGAWAFRKELERSRRYLRNNMFSMNTDTRNNLKAAHAKCELLEECAIVQYSWLKDNTQFPETLEVTENRQYRERGLLHISDCAYNFILRLESLRVELVNNHRLKQSSNKDSFVDDAILSLHDNEELRSLWSVVFEGSDADQEVSTCRRHSIYIIKNIGGKVKGFRGAVYVLKCPNVLL